MLGEHVVPAFAEPAATPDIASGGAGTMQHFADVLDQGHASAVLAASLFHFGHAIGRTNTPLNPSLRSG